MDKSRFKLIISLNEGSGEPDFILICAPCDDPFKFIEGCWVCESCGYSTTLINSLAFFEKVGIANKSIVKSIKKCLPRRFLWW